MGSRLPQPATLAQSSSRGRQQQRGGQPVGQAAPRPVRGGSPQRGRRHRDAGTAARQRGHAAVAHRHDIRVGPHLLGDALQAGRGVERAAGNLRWPASEASAGARCRHRSAADNPASAPAALTECVWLLMFQNSRSLVSTSSWSCEDEGGSAGGGRSALAPRAPQRCPSIGAASQEDCWAPAGAPAPPLVFHSPTSAPLAHRRRDTRPHKQLFGVPGAPGLTCLPPFRRPAQPLASLCRCRR